MLRIYVVNLIRIHNLLRAFSLWLLANLQKMKIVIAQYAHPEAYPPTLNAILEWALRCDKVIVICRQLLQTHSSYPANVEFRYATPYLSVFDVEKQPFFRKIWFFIKFVGLLISNLKTERPQLIVVYDAIALFAFKIADMFGCKPKPALWYHNHDVPDIKACRKFSVSWFAAKYEHSTLLKADFFSLPAREREQYYPLQQFSGKYFFIPNFPRLAFYSQYQKSDFVIGDTVKLFYHGSLGEKHGFEEIISMLNTPCCGKHISLTLIGKIRPLYKQQLLEIAQSHNTQHRLTIIDFVPISKLPELLLQYHIGLATHIPNRITYTTGGTASNKIYECMALGLPVILYEDAHYRKHLSRFEWTFFTDLTQESFVAQIGTIIGNYQYLSQKARHDFIGGMNFETQFNIVYQSISKSFTQ